MTGLEKTVFLDFINDSFSGNRYECELRLSTIEKQLLKNTYPSAVVTEMNINSSSDKHWFKVKLNKRIKK